MNDIQARVQQDKPTWDACKHEWVRAPGDWDSSFEEVVCRICGVPGERDEKTGGVFWPAT